MTKQPKHTKITLAVIGALALMSGSVAMAGSLTVPTIGSGTAATSADMNTKFGSIGAAVTDNDGRITTNATNIGNNTTAIGSKADASAVTTNATNIGNNTTAIGAKADATTVTTNTTNIGNNTTAIGAKADLTALTAHINDGVAHSGGGGTTESSADNPPITVNCSTESLQEKIESAPLHGRTEITISGACSDDIFIRRSGITIQGATGPGTDSITGDVSGFSSDPLVDFDVLGADPAALVKTSLDAAVQLTGRNRVVIKNLTINAGANATGLLAERGSDVKLINVTVVGGTNGVGIRSVKSHVHVKNTTVTGDATGAASIFAGSAVVADLGSVLIIESGNTFTGGSGEASGLISVASDIRMTGGNNAIVAGVDIDGPDGDEPFAMELVMNSTLTQISIGTGSNAITGDIDVGDSSSMFMQKVAISSNFIGVFGNATIILEPSSPGDITIAIGSGGQIELGLGGSLDMGDDGTPVTISNAGGGATMRLLDHASLLFWSGSVINMNVELHRGSSIDAGDNAKLNGNLQVHGFSTYVNSGQTGSSVSGTVTCGNAEAFDFDASFNSTDLCNPPPS